MKTLTQAIALVGVTTLFATAFTTEHFAQQSKLATGAGAAVEQVVIVGKRMSALEKSQYDAAMLAQSATPASESTQSGLKIAVK